MDSPSNSQADTTPTSDVPATPAVETIPAEQEAGFGKTTGLLFDDQPRSDFENFRKVPEDIVITRNVAEDASGDLMADRLTMDNNQIVYVYRSGDGVREGTSYTGEARLWTNEGETVQVNLQVKNFCSADNDEQSTETVQLTGVPQTFSVTHTFEYDQECVAFNIINSTSGEASIYGSDVTLTAN